VNNRWSFAALGLTTVILASDIISDTQAIYSEFAKKVNFFRDNLQI
jgi:hypothetical protein